jgi:dienelactone hydrolase
LGADLVAALVRWLKQNPVQLLDARCRSGETTTGNEETSPSPPAPLDRLRLGLLGHSFGASVLAEFARASSEAEAMVNLDGWMFSDDLAQLERIPYLAIVGDLTMLTPADVQGSDKAPVSPYEARLNERFLSWHRAAAETADVELRHIDGAIHADFSNEERSDQQRWKDWISGRDTQRSRIRRSIIDRVARFFLTHMPSLPRQPRSAPASPDR